MSGNIFIFEKIMCVFIVNVIWIVGFGLVEVIVEI